MKTQTINYQSQTLFKITWPIFIEIALRMAMGIIATLMLGRYSDAAASGVGVANQLLSLFILIFNVTSIGATILIGQSLGAKQYQRAEQIAHSVFFMNFWFGVIVSAVVVLFGEYFLGLFHLHGMILQDGLLFIRICGASLFLESLSLAMSAILRSHGFTKDAMIITVIMDGISVLGNVIATNGPFGLPITGVSGVSWAMVIARVFAIVALSLVIWKRLNVKFSFKDCYRASRKNIHDLLSIGVPSAGEMLSYQLSQLIITAFVVMIGTGALAARIYILNITMLCFLFTVAIAQGTELLIARYIGGGQSEQAYKRGIKTVIIAMASSTLVSIIIALSGVVILGLFTTTSAIIVIGLPVLWINLFSEPGRAINIVLMGSLKSAGDVRFPVVIGVVSMWLIAVGLSYLLGVHFGFGLIGIWLAQGADEWFRGLFALKRWQSRPWEHRQSFFFRKAVSK
ncbi:MATE family efflux transporter [Sporolactobacillus laevolacticus]|uniref:Multidrug transporter MATE n=1 Tax=Sporolactobacillus laevolacticus DSM 442 TaxID=1395513 RepID=V6IZC1_9BACL|nr:MATE family efflux transporter [Sporolactobacillus laevolacticus]EST12903.1 multidrug transporter MATE [Sporolactobacillus laevolacticus DSM 442]